jgi:hypothetical protein
MNTLLDVTWVKPLPDHWLALSFENGEPEFDTLTPI